MDRSLCSISSRSSLSSSSRLCISLPRMISTCSSKFLKGFVISNIERPRRDEPQPGSSLRVVHCLAASAGRPQNRLPRLRLYYASVKVKKFYKNILILRIAKLNVTGQQNKGEGQGKRIRKCVCLCTMYNTHDGGKCG